MSHVRGETKSIFLCMNSNFICQRDIYIYIYIFYVLYHRSHRSLAMTNRCSSIHVIVINPHIVSFFLSTCEVLIAILGFLIFLNCDLNTTYSNLTHFAESNIYFSGENV